MKMIFVSSFCKRNGSISVSARRFFAVSGVALVALVSGAFWAGLTLGEREAAQSTTDAATLEVRALLEQERRAIAAAKAE